MSPAAETRVDLLRLFAETADDQSSCQARHDRLAALWLREDVWSIDSPWLALIALELHHYYCAVESCLERSILAFEGKLPNGPEWHREVLHLAALPLPEVRPAILTKSSERSLAELMRFRHFLRHAYSADLEPERLRVLVRGLIGGHAGVVADLETFREHVRACADALAE